MADERVVLEIQLEGGESEPPEAPRRRIRQQREEVLEDQVRQQELRRRERQDALRRVRAELGPTEPEQRRSQELESRQEAARQRRIEAQERRLEQLRERRDRQQTSEAQRSRRLRRRLSQARERRARERRPEEEIIREQEERRLRRRRLREQIRGRLDPEAPRSLLDSIFSGGTDEFGRRRRPTQIPVTAIQEFARTLGPASSRVALGFARVTAASAPVAAGLAGITAVLAPLAISAKSVSEAFDLIRESRGISPGVTAALQIEDVRRQLSIRRQAGALEPELVRLIELRSERDEVLREINVAIQSKLLPIVIPVLEELLEIVRSAAPVLEWLANLSTSGLSEEFIQRLFFGPAGPFFLKLRAAIAKYLESDDDEQDPIEIINDEIRAFLGLDVSSRSRLERELERRFGDITGRRRDDGRR